MNTAMGHTPALRPVHRSFVASFVASFIALFTSMLFLPMIGCGGGGTVAPDDLALVQFRFVDRGLLPVAPTGSTDVPRNAQIVLEFTENLDPGSVTEQTVQLRGGPSGASLPTGSVRVQGRLLILDPTLRRNGQANPFGFEAFQQFQVRLPGVSETGEALRSVSGDALAQAFETTFTTSGSFLREAIPPEFVRIRFQPDPDVVTGNIPGNGTMAIEFSEPMDPASFRLGGRDGVEADTSIDIRYVSDSVTNQDGGVDGLPIPGRFTASGDGRTWFFRPLFSFGDQQYVFSVQVLQELRDLAGNRLINPQSVGPFRCDGLGSSVGLVITEPFDLPIDRDGLATTADWGSTEVGTLSGVPITSRDVHIFGYTFAANGRGRYAPLADPLIGADLNPLVPGIQPPTAQGRRVLTAHDDTEIGERGVVTGMAWGPDQNATFAATYPSMVIRLGFQRDASLALSSNFAGNYDGQPTTFYTGTYSVPQAANIGNTPGHPAFPEVQPAGTPPAGCAFPNFAPLFNFTGFEPYPAPTTLFSWDPGSSTPGDRVLLFDVSVAEGDSFNSVRSWTSETFPCSGVQIPGFPTRHVRGTHLGEDANPLGTAATPNPGATVMDTRFTLTRKTSVAQSLFYTPVGEARQNSGGSTFGVESDYDDALLTPVVQSGGAVVRIEYQGAALVEADGRTINQAGAFTPWTVDVDDCDGFPYIRWRIVLDSNLVSQQIPTLQSVQIPVRRGE